MCQLSAKLHFTFSNAEHIAHTYYILLLTFCDKRNFKTNIHRTLFIKFETKTANNNKYEVGIQLSNCAFRKKSNICINDRKT